MQKEIVDVNAPCSDQTLFHENRFVRSRKLDLRSRLKIMSICIVLLDIALCLYGLRGRGDGCTRNECCRMISNGYVLSEMCDELLTCREYC